jgi:hypothetical protein
MPCLSNVASQSRQGKMPLVVIVSPAASIKLTM